MRIKIIFPSVVKFFGLTSQLELGGGLERIALGPAHHALVHAAVLTTHSGHHQRVLHASRGGQLAAVLVPQDVLHAHRTAVARDQAAELRRAAHVNAEDIRGDFHLDGRGHREAELGTSLAAHIAGRALVDSGILASHRLDGQDGAEQTDTRTTQDGQGSSSIVGEPAAGRWEEQGESERFMWIRLL